MKSSTPSRRQQKREANRAKWRSWDWFKQDRQLALETGLSRQRLTQIRRLLGIPQSPNRGKDLARLRRTTTTQKWVAANLKLFKGLSGAEVRRKYGLNPHRPSFEFLKVQGVLRDYRKHPWNLMNFDLPSSLLERIWKLPCNAAASYRSRKRLSAAQWTRRNGSETLARRSDRRAYNRAVRAEQRKAAKHFAERGLL